MFLKFTRVFWKLHGLCSDCKRNRNIFSVESTCAMREQMSWWWWHVIMQMHGKGEDSCDGDCDDGDRDGDYLDGDHNITTIILSLP